MQVVFFLVYIFEAAVAYMYFSENYKQKWSTVKVLLIAFGLYVIGFVGNLVFKNAVYINTVNFFIINAALGYVCFDISLKSSAFHSAFLMLINYCCEIIPEVGFNYIFGIPVLAYRENTFVLIILAIITKMLYLTVLRILLHFVSYKEHNKQENKSIAVSVIYSLIVAMMLEIFVYILARYELPKSFSLFCVILGSISVIFSCFVFIFNRNLQKQQNELLELKMQAQKDNADLQYLNLLEKKNEQMNIISHDLKNHLILINSMNNMEDVKRYTDSMLGELAQGSRLASTENKILDVVLGKYIDICEEKGIRLEIQARDENLSFMEINDVSSMMNNLLDNAVEAAEKSEEERKILLNIARVNNSFISVTVINSCDTPPVSKNGRLISTKHNKELHGYGTRSIERVVEKYNGIFRWKYDEVKKTFSYEIAFNR